jgi:hypothetical protein
MGLIRVALENEKGGTLQEVKGDTHLLDPVLPDAEEAEFQCVRFIDPYGDTVFNRLQMKQFLEEWEVLAKRVRGTETSKVFEEVRELARQCRAEPHSYLKFYGD